MKLVKDYDLQVRCHPGKENVGADALSRKMQNSLNIVVIIQIFLPKELESMGIQLVSHGKTDVQLSALTLLPSLVDEL